MLIIFTDQLERLADLPGWLRHVPNPIDDAMSIRDFGPAAFLFIVGLSIPLSQERQRARASR